MRNFSKSVQNLLKQLLVLWNTHKNSTAQMLIDGRNIVGDAHQLRRNIRTDLIHGLRALERWSVPRIKAMEGSLEEHVLQCQDLRNMVASLKVSPTLHDTNMEYFRSKLVEAHPGV